MLSNKVSTSNTNLSQPIHPASTASSAASSSQVSLNSTSGLEKGQIIQGEITDVKFKEIGIRLEDGRILNGSLDDTASLSIGDKVTFRVEEVSLKNLVLKIISESPSVSIQNTIDKALEAAGLSKTPRNLSIVKELLNQQMPVDKKTISLLIQQSIANKESDVSTLVLMNKLHFPITKENVRMFEAFINRDFNIMSKIGKLADQIPELFDFNKEVLTREDLMQAKNLLNVILPSDTIFEGDKPLTSYINGDPQFASFLQSNPQLTAMIESGTVELKEILELFHQYNAGKSTNPDLIKQLINNPDINQLQNTVGNVQSTDKLQITGENTSGTSQMQIVGETVQGINLLQNSKENAPGKNLLQNSGENAAVTSQMQSAMDSLPIAGTGIGMYLTTAERTNLIDLLKNFSLPETMKEQIKSGISSTTEVLDWIRNNLETAENTAKDLFSSKEFKQMIKESLIEKWAITPQSLKNTDLDIHFEHLAAQVNDFKEYVEQSTAQSHGTIFSQAAHVQENINFAHTLNQLFTYVPLPLKLQNQTTHGELFVYTRKKSGRTAADGINVLLHLDMDNLGPVDINISLQGNHITSKFYLDDVETVHLIESYLPNLEQTLEQKGYTVTTDVQKREQTGNIAKEFMEQESTSSPIMRYNFDVRA